MSVRLCPRTKFNGNLHISPGDQVYICLSNQRDNYILQYYSTDFRVEAQKHRLEYRCAESVLERLTTII